VPTETEKKDLLAFSSNFLLCNFYCFPVSSKISRKRITCTDAPAWVINVNSSRFVTPWNGWAWYTLHHVTDTSIAGHEPKNVSQSTNFHGHTHILVTQSMQEELASRLEITNKNINKFFYLVSI
jgi:hypothetical protein